MSLWSRFEEKRARHRLEDDDAKLKTARNALAMAFDLEAEVLNGGKMIEYGSSRAEVEPAVREAKDLGSFTRKLVPNDPRIADAGRFASAGLLSPLDEGARKVLAEPWPGGFDPEAKLAAVMKALQEALTSKV